MDVSDEKSMPLEGRHGPRMLDGATPSGRRKRRRYRFTNLEIEIRGARIGTIAGHRNAIRGSQ